MRPSLTWAAFWGGSLGSLSSEPDASRALGWIAIRSVAAPRALHASPTSSRTNTMQTMAWAMFRLVRRMIGEPWLWRGWVSHEERLDLASGEASRNSYDRQERRCTPAMSLARSRPTRISRSRSSSTLLQAVDLTLEAFEALQPLYAEAPCRRRTSPRGAGGSGDPERRRSFAPVDSAFSPEPPCLRTVRRGAQSCLVRRLASCRRRSNLTPAR